MDENQNRVKVTDYITNLDFDPQSLRDITITLEGNKMLETKPTEVEIPPNSRVRLTFRIFCLDEGKLPPDANEPYIFSYEMVDMPMYLKIMKYFIEHPEVDQSTAQNLIWKLSKKQKFEELSKHEQDILLAIDPYADAEVDNYKSIKYEPWKGYPTELWPEEIVPQPIPGTGIFAKILKTKGFSEVHVEFYNPTPTYQKIILLKSNPGSLTGMFLNALRQRFGFTIPGGKTGYFESGGLGGMADEEWE